MPRTPEKATLTTLEDKLRADDATPAAALTTGLDTSALGFTTTGMTSPRSRTPSRPPSARLSTCCSSGWRGLAGAVAGRSWMAALATLLFLGETGCTV